MAHGEARRWPCDEKPLASARRQMHEKAHPLPFCRLCRTSRCFKNAAFGKRYGIVVVTLPLAPYSTTSLDSARGGDKVPERPAEPTIEFRSAARTMPVFHLRVASRILIVVQQGRWVLLLPPETGESCESVKREKGCGVSPTIQLTPCPGRLAFQVRARPIYVLCTVQVQIQVSTGTRRHQC